MRKLLTCVLAAALALGLAVAQPADAKVYKMKPEERAAALKEKKARKARAKKSKKAAEEPNGGWVEVKPGSKRAAAAPEKKEKASRKKAGEETKPASAKSKKKSKKAKTVRAAEEKAAKITKSSKRKSRDRNVPAREAFRGDRTGASVAGSSAEVSKPAGPNLDSYSVSRPGYEKGAQAPAAAPVVPEVRHEVQPGPVDSSKPLSTEMPKGGEGRF